MADRIKKPVMKGVAKVPVVMQLEALECGAACLAMILAYFDKWVALEQVRSDCGVSRDGSNAKNIIQAARYYGMEANGYRFEVDSIKEINPLKIILFGSFATGEYNGSDFVFDGDDIFMPVDSGNDFFNPRAKLSTIFSFTALSYVTGKDII